MMRSEPRPTLKPTIKGMLFVDIIPKPLETTLTEVTGNPPKLEEELSPEERADEAALISAGEEELVVTVPEASTEPCFMELKVIASA